jgi:hypothetical protein
MIAAWKLMTAILVVPVGAGAAAAAAGDAAGALPAWAKALSPIPETSRQVSGNEREITRFMEIKNSSVLSEIARTRGSELRFLIYLLRSS